MNGDNIYSADLAEIIITEDELKKKNKGTGQRDYSQLQSGRGDCNGLYPKRCSYVYG